MPSERIQRRIDRLLDQAAEAADAEDWVKVAERVRMVLGLDTANEDALALQTMVEQADGSAEDRSQPLLAEPVAPSPEIPLPDSFVDGRYQVKDFLGEGGRKQVYLAHDTRLDRDVAFAVIKTEGLAANGRQRIQREAEAMGRLSRHPHIVTIYGHEGASDEGEIMFGKPLFPRYQVKADLPAKASAQDFDVPASHGAGR